MAGAINIRVSAVVSDLISAFQSGGRAAAQFADTVNGQLTQAFNAADRASRIAERGIGRLAGTFQSFGRQASIVSAGIGLLGVSSFKAYADIDSLKRGLTAVMGSATAAEEEFKKLRIVAALPGLGLAEAAQGSVRLQAVGFSAQEARDALLQFGNAAALTGGGKAQLEQITFQLGQLAAKGKVLSQDLRPIIEAAPAIAPILNKAFGSVDPEIISSKLAAAGKSSKDFVGILVQSLAGLDRVSGGPKTAMENIADSVTIAQNNFASAADKVLGLTDKINALGNVVGGLADRFATLSPFAQKVILGVVGVTAVVGPLALAIGGILAIVPSVIAGAAALTAALGVGLAPIAAVAAGIAIAATVIVSNWDTVKSVLTQSGIWSTLTNLVTSGIETIKAAFTVGTAILGFIWNRFSGFIVGAIRVGFDGVAGVFNFAGGVLRGIMGVLTGVLTLNWSKFSNGFIDLAKSLWNAVIDIFKFGIGAVGRTLAGTLQFFGGTTLADKVTAGLDKALTRLDGLKGKLSEVVAVAAKPLAGPAVAAAAGSNKPAAPAIDFSGLGGKSEIDQVKDRLKQLKAEIFAGRVAGKDVSALVDEYKRLKAQIDETNKSLKTQKEKISPIKTELQVFQSVEKQLVEDIQKLGGAAPKALLDSLDAVRDKIKDIKASTSDAVLNPKQIFNKDTAAKLADNIRTTLETAIPKLNSDLKAQLDTVNQYGTLNFYQEGVAKIQTQIQSLSLKNLAVPRSTIQVLADYNAQLDKASLALRKSQVAAFESQFTDKDRIASVSVPGFDLTLFRRTKQQLFDDLQNMKEGIRGALENAAETALIGMGEVIGGLIAGTAGIDALPNLLLTTMGDLLVNLGKIAIQTAIGIGAIKTALETLNPVVAAVAGVALIALGTIVRSQVSNLGKSSGAAAFANGGIVSGPTLGLVGEYVGARNNPEVIAPLNKLKDLLPGGGRDVRVRGELKLRNRELVAAIDTEREAQDYNS